MIENELLKERITQVNIPRLTIIYSVLLIIIGIIGYIASGAASITALIPTFFGMILLLLGLLARKEHLRKLTTHIAVVLGLIGFVATAGAIGDLVAIISGEDVQRQLAVVIKSIMSILSLLYIIICTKSFINARRAKV